jgi:hypothetical protein
VQQLSVPPPQFVVPPPAAAQLAIEVQAPLQQTVPVPVHAVPSPTLLHAVVLEAGVHTSHPLFAVAPDA